MIQDPLWTPLSYTLATLGCMCDILCSCPFLPSRRPFSLFLLFGCVCVFVVFGVVLPFVQFLLPSLRREKSGAQFSLCVFSGVSKALVDFETLGKERVLPLR